MARHLFDIKERGTHSLVADQLRALADQIATGSLDMAYDEWHAPTVIVDPMDMVIDLASPFIAKFPSYGFPDFTTP